MPGTDNRLRWCPARGGNRRDVGSPAAWCPRVSWSARASLGRPGQHRPDQGQAGACPWMTADDLDPSTGLTEAARWVSAAVRAP